MIHLPRGGDISLVEHGFRSQRMLAALEMARRVMLEAGVPILGEHAPTLSRLSCAAWRYRWVLSVVFFSGVSRVPECRVPVTDPKRRNRFVAADAAAARGHGGRLPFQRMGVSRRHVQRKFNLEMRCAHGDALCVRPVDSIQGTINPEAGCGRAG